MLELRGSTSLPTFAMIHGVDFLILAYLMSVQSYLIILICFSLINYEIEHFFIGHLCIFFCEEPIQIFCLFDLFACLFCFFLNFFQFFLHIIKFAEDYICCKYLLLFSDLPFSTLLRVGFAEHRFLILIWFISSLFFLHGQWLFFCVTRSRYCSYPKIVKIFVLCYLLETLFCL